MPLGDKMRQSYTNTQIWITNDSIPVHALLVCTVCINLTSNWLNQLFKWGNDTNSYKNRNTVNSLNQRNCLAKSYLSFHDTVLGKGATLVKQKICQCFFFFLIFAEWLPQWTFWCPYVLFSPCHLFLPVLCCSLLRNEWVKQNICSLSVEWSQSCTGLPITFGTWSVLQVWCCCEMS